MSVSRVINDNGYVSKQMREKVLKVVKELNYHPNALARGLKSLVNPGHWYPAP